MSNTVHTSRKHYFSQSSRHAHTRTHTPAVSTPQVLFPDQARAAHPAQPSPDHLHALSPQQARAAVGDTQDTNSRNLHPNKSYMYTCAPVDLCVCARARVYVCVCVCVCAPPPFSATVSSSLTLFVSSSSSPLLQPRPQPSCPPSQAPRQISKTSSSSHVIKFILKCVRVCVCIYIYIYSSKRGYNSWIKI
jgi:hypothetical protein